MGQWPARGAQKSVKPCDGVMPFPNGFTAAVNQRCNHVGTIDDIDFQQCHDNATGQQLRSSIEHWRNADIPALECAVVAGSGRPGVLD